MRNGRYVAWVVMLVPACFSPRFPDQPCGPQDECPAGTTCSSRGFCEPTTPDAGGINDVMVDSIDDSAGGSEATPPDAQLCFGSFVRVCFNTAADVPTSPVMLGTTNIPTDSAPVCHQHNDQATKYCVIAGTSITTLPSTILRAYGIKPLVLLSTTTADISGNIDVSSRNGVANPVGAGANPTGSDVCTGATLAAGVSGGFGGSFGGRGGDGESKDGAQGIPSPAQASFPDKLRGGCPGGDGAGGGGRGGDGGGAVAIIATTIQLSGTINASGAGGHGGPATKSGGGGGGSGGMIVLDASTVSATGALFANGGGGGQAGSTTAAGDDGGESTGPTNTAQGGNNTSNAGGSGGRGSSGANLSGANATGGSQGSGGGGAGGGGAGFIRAPGVTTNIAPPSS